jgi:hypothetical protein
MAASNTPQYPEDYRTIDDLYRLADQVEQASPILDDRCASALALVLGAMEDWHTVAVDLCASPEAAALETLWVHELAAFLLVLLPSDDDED